MSLIPLRLEDARRLRDRVLREREAAARQAQRFLGFNARRLAEDTESVNLRNLQLANLKSGRLL